LMTEFVYDGDLARRTLNDFERVRGGQHPWQTVWHTESARRICKGSVLQSGDVLVVGCLARGREGQIAAADNLDFRVVFRRPVNTGEVHCFCGSTGREQDRYDSSGKKAFAWISHGVILSVWDQPQKAR